MSHVYAFLFRQPVSSSFPSAEIDAQRTQLSCWRGRPTGRLVSRFHTRAVLFHDVLAKRRSLKNKKMKFVWPRSPAKWLQVAVLNILIWPYEPDINFFPSDVQVQVRTMRSSSLFSSVASSLPVLASHILNSRLLMSLPGRLGQPFGTFLLLQQRGGEFQTITSDFLANKS